METSAPKAPPSVAPMNSEGEKMPPDAPEPRLIEVAASLRDKEQRAAWQRERADSTAGPVGRIAWIVA